MPGQRARGQRTPGLLARQIVSLLLGATCRQFWRLAQRSGWGWHLLTEGVNAADAQSVQGYKLPSFSTPPRPPRGTDKIRGHRGTRGKVKVVQLLGLFVKAFFCVASASASRVHELRPRKAVIFAG